MPDPNLPICCEYKCVNGVRIFIGGTPPEGYECRLEDGVCTIEGELTSTVPVPITEPIPDDPPGGDGASFSLTASSAQPNSAIYTYNVGSSKLYFLSGKAESGSGFFPTLTLEQLSAYYPSIAEELSALKAMKSLTSFKVTLPALPVSVVARRDA
jgi:hypothetical protein